MGVLSDDVHVDRFSLNRLQRAQILPARPVKDDDLVTRAKTQYVAGMVSFAAGQDRFDTLAFFGRKIETVHENLETPFLR